MRHHISKLIVHFALASVCATAAETQTHPASNNIRIGLGISSQVLLENSTSYHTKLCSAAF